ncbi:UbiA prenyltransferase [Rhodofomes roseus]|uniref:UbiA prenyltransferase n=1 Tax=Rhodofomes roseus TaxID=34475 RepID=A0ABQ8K620_9APHY|nr:UbiA prenyltransferase [Rhodofomes roseus]KAH9832526.1 UbiA prenyltransferase [Rhodofomes roseus]
MSDNKATLKSKSTTPAQPAPKVGADCKLYWRLTRMHVWPTGGDLVWFPAMWALLMSAYRLSLPPRTVAVHALVHAVACTFAHSAGCIWNDICDRDIDKHVERTKTRPIASGEITVPAALLLMEIPALGYFATMSYLGSGTMTLGAMVFFTVAPIYPLSKRFTNWPQLVLGVNCAWNAIVGWYAVNHTVDWSVVGSLSLGMTCWAVHFDTVYASPDKKFDKEFGVYSCAILFGDYIRPILSLFCAAFVGCLAYAGYANHQGPLYYAIAVGYPALGLLWQLVTTDNFETQDGIKIIKANASIGYLTVAGLLADYVYEVVL